MDQNNYSFMKSGFDQTSNDTSSNPNFELSIASILSSFASNALENSEKYVIHSDRNGITSDDIKLALKGEVFIFLNRHGITEDTEEWRQRILEEADREDDEHETEENAENEPLEPFKKSTCVCTLCNYLNNVEERFESWEPTSPLERILKNNISSM